MFEKLQIFSCMIITGILVLTNAYSHRIGECTWFREQSTMYKFQEKSIRSKRDYDWTRPKAYKYLKKMSELGVGQLNHLIICFHV